MDIEEKGCAERHVEKKKWEAKKKDTMTELKGRVRRQRKREENRGVEK